jgi:hypothetical protein
MKKLLILLFSLLISFNSLGEWKKYWEGGGESAYVDISNIKQNDGHVYYWRMIDYPEPQFSWELMSAQIYNQGHCNLNRIKTLSYVYYKKGMGEGYSEQQASDNKDWKYPTPNSYGLLALNYVCEYVK